MPAYGRIPSPPDHRDFALEAFLPTTTATLDDASLRDLAVTKLKSTTVSYPQWQKNVQAGKYNPTNGSTTAWGQAFNLLAQIGGSPNPPPPPTGKVSWNNPRTTLDQGEYGTCVGNGAAQWGNTDPINDNYTEKDARAIYYDATVFDGSPDDPDSAGGGQQGATVRSGMKALQKRGRLNAYAAANSLDSALQWILTKGSVVFGSDFTFNMEQPDQNGLVHYSPNDVVAGGHCYDGVGYDPSTELIEFLNSWGPNWALNGRFYMHKSEYQQLWDTGSEAWTAVELPV